jgi:stage III sporulation protein AD
VDFFRVICGVWVGVLLALKLKGLNSPLTVYLSIALCLFLLFFIGNRLQFVLDFLENVISQIGLEAGYFEILIKIVGVSYLCEFTASVCREAGFLAVAGQVELGGKLTMMIMSMPILMAIVETITTVL